MQGLVDILRLYPEYQQEFANDIQHDLTFNVREGYEAEVSIVLLMNNLIHQFINQNRIKWFHSHIFTNVLKAKFKVSLQK